MQRFRIGPPVQSKPSANYPRANILGKERDCAVQNGGSFGKAPQGLIYKRKLFKKLQVAWIELHGFFHAARRFAPPPLAIVDMAHQFEKLSVVWKAATRQILPY